MKNQTKREKKKIGAKKVHFERVFDGVIRSKHEEWSL
jgi:hypothetical protein